MRLALAQLNPTVGDLDRNAQLCKDAIARAHDARADLCVLPELAICGYPPKDLLLVENFVRDCAAVAREVLRWAATSAPGLTIILGTPLPANADELSRADGKLPSGVHNSLLAYRDGRMLAYYDKRLLPTYDVFDEDRYFVPGDRPVVIDVPTRAGRTWRVGLSICEDLWRGEDAGFAWRYARAADPVAELLMAQPDGGRGAELIINPSASPFVLGKAQRHRDLLSRLARERNVFVAATNQVGANDELIFDGHAAAFAPGGALIATGPAFEEHLLVADLSTPVAINDAPSTDSEQLYRALVLGVRDYAHKTGFRSAMLGLSGGIDSAVTCVLAAAALGPSNVLGVSLPGPYSSEGSKLDAYELGKRLHVRVDTVPIASAFDTFTRELTPLFASQGKADPDLTEENLQSRCRGVILMAISNKLGHLLLTTGNKSEMSVGYCTLYGDMNGGLAVLSDVTKHWVYELARWMNEHWPELGIAGLSGPPIPEPSITKPPSAELRPNQTDQDSLPPYDQLDAIVQRLVEQHQSPTRVHQETSIDPATIARISRLIDVSEFKRKQAAIGLKVTTVAFGSGRRMPIAQRYRLRV